MSLSKVSHGEAAATYYESSEDYYSEDGRAPSEWWGAGADALGLSGAVDGAQFKALLDGALPDGSALHGGSEGRRAGTDLTFSAPKSVSMQALIGGDTRLINAHDLAVSRTLAYAEKRLAAYRLTVDGDTHRLSSGSLLVARFRHDLSRDCDPQLHSHCVVVNATRTTRGEWRALDISDFYREQKLLGAFYRAELALEVQRLGYQVRLTHDDGRFELAHLASSHLEAFSHRSQSIEKALATRGKTRVSASAREKELASLSTRQSKAVINRGDLRTQWLATSRALGIDYTPSAPHELSPTTRTAGLQAAVSHAIEHATERECIVAHANLAFTALGRATGFTNLAEVESELTRRVEAGELKKAGGKYTTEAAQAREREMLAIEQRGRGTVVALSHPQEVLPSLTASTLNAGQRAAAEAILTSHDRVLGIQGLAGTGKTHMLAQVQAAAGSKGWRVVGVAPSAAAAQEVRKSGIEAGTIAAFLARPNRILDDRTMVVVDEAGMVPTTDMLAILRAAELADARVVLVGDTQQLKAVNAGRPFAQLQEAGMRTVEMSEILRQRDATLKAAVEQAAKGKVLESLRQLAPHITEIDRDHERYARIAREYVTLHPAKREQTLIVSGTNAGRMAINEQVRERLGLTGSGMAVTVLERRDLTKAQLKSSLSYYPGDIVVMQAHYESLGLTRGMSAIVVRAEAGKVTLKRPDGQCVEWQPALKNKVAAYVPTERELALLDEVRFNENNYGRDYINGDRGQVVAIDRERMVLTVRKSDGQEVRLDASQPLQLDYGYCTTVHSAQGQTCERVMIDADVKSVVTNESLYYVAISRATSDVQLYTDDRSLLPEAMSRQSVKTNALELERQEKVNALDR